MHRINPSLSKSQKNHRIDFICDQRNVVNMDESWYFLLKDKEKIRMFPDKATPGRPGVQRKGRVPTIVIIVAKARPDPSHNFDGKVGYCEFAP